MFEWFLDHLYVSRRLCAWFSNKSAPFKWFLIVPMEFYRQRKKNQNRKNSGERTQRDWRHIRRWVHTETEVISNQRTSNERSIDTVGLDRESIKECKSIWKRKGEREVGNHRHQWPEGRVIIAKHEQGSCLNKIFLKDNNYHDKQHQQSGGKIGRKEC